MSWIYTACGASEALPLYWEDQPVSMERQALVGDLEAGIPPTIQTITETVVVPGLHSCFPQAPSIEYCSGWGTAQVDDNKISIPDPNNVPQYYDVTITATGGTRLVTSREVEGFSITLSAPSMYKTDPQYGYLATAVQLGIYYRVHGSAGAWHVVDPYFIISGVQRSEIIRTINVPNCADGLNTYEILIVRVTPDNSISFDTVDAVYVKDLTEIVYSSVAYNHTALLGVKIRATDQLSGSPPAVTCIVQGTKVAVPSNMVTAYQNRYEPVGSLTNPKGNYAYWNSEAAYTAGWLDGKLSDTKVWTDNPVWCLYDLLTNKRYGLGDYYKISETKRGLMLANFYLMAKYCDEPIQYTDAQGVTSIDMWRPRFALNIVLDQSKTALEWITQICSIMRANLYYAEGIFWIDIDRPKDMTQLFNMSNIADYTQTSTSYREIANTYEVQWINPVLDYEIDSFKLEDISLQLDNTIEERKKALTLVGVTNPDMAKSLAKYALLAGKYCTKMVTFKTGTDGLRSMVGDVVGIQHDVPLWGWGGEILAYDAGTRQITLSSSFAPQADMTLVTTIKSATSELKEIALVNTGWDGSEIYTATLATTPSDDITSWKYVIGKVTAKVAPFRITGIKRQDDDMCEITALEYHEDIYAMCDDASDSTVFHNNDYSLLPDTYRISVQGVTANTKVYQDTSGAYKVGIEVFYTVPVNTFWKSAKVWWRKTGDANYNTMTENTNGYFFIDTISESGDYEIVVTSVYTRGQQTITDALNDTDRHPYTTITVDLYIPNDVFSEGITGLAIENVAKDGTFVGKDCVLIWNKPVAINAQANTTATGTAGTTGDTWVGDYEVKITGLINGEKKRIQRVPQERYVYTHEMNYTDATDGDADRHFTVSVTAVDKVGRRSKTKSLDCYNPAPAKIEASI